MERELRCTRSQAAPDWSVRECLTLINEISAIEGEWRQALASFQKWQLVVENCNALEVNRSLNQCKKKWDELRALYRKVKPWKSSFWSFNTNKKRELGIPEEFDCELFKAIDRYFKKKGTEDNNAEGPETDPDTDHQHQANTNKFFLKTAPKKQRKKMVRRKRKIFESFQPWGASVGTNVKQEPSSLNEMPEVPRDKDDDIALKVELEPNTEGGREKMMAAELLKNTELINAIIQGNLAEDGDIKLANMKTTEAVQADFTRLQGDKLIDCLGKIANKLNQICDLVQECN